MPGTYINGISPLIQIETGIHRACTQDSNQRIYLFHFMYLPSTIVSRASLAGSIHLAASAAAIKTLLLVSSGTNIGHASCCTW